MSTDPSDFIKDYRDLEHEVAALRIALRDAQHARDALRLENNALKFRCGQAAQTIKKIITEVLT